MLTDSLKPREAAATVFSSFDFISRLWEGAFSLGVAVIGARLCACVVLVAAVMGRSVV